METENLRLNSEKIVDSYIDKSDWREKENANMTFSFSGLMLHSAGTIMAHYALRKMYPHRIAKAHYDGEIHLHDLSAPIIPYCVGHSLRSVLSEGLSGVGHIESKPAKHFSSMLLQLVNYLGMSQHEFAGANAFSSLDTYLAPFIAYDNLKPDDIKQSLQEFVFNLNTTSRWGGQLNFSNCLVGNETVFKKEGDLIRRKRINTLKEGDTLFALDDDGNLKETRLIRITKKKVERKLEIHLKYKKSFFSIEGSIDHKVQLVDGSWKEFKELKKGDTLKHIDYINTFPYYKRARSINYAKTVNSKMGRAELRIAKLIQSFNLPLEYNKDLVIESCIPDFNVMGNKKKIIEADAYQITPHTRKKIKIYKKHEYECLVLTVSPDKTDSELVSEILQFLHNGAEVIHIEEKNASTGFIHNQFGSTEKKYVAKYTVYEISCEPYHNYISKGLVSHNCTLDWIPASDLSEEYIVHGGEVKKDKYNDFIDEQESFNNALMDIFIEGDKNNRPFTFPIPTVNITPDFPWKTDLSFKLFDVTAKYGLPYFDNYINALKLGSARAMCCHLRIPLDELREKGGGGLFGAGENCGSVGVVSINMNRIGYLAKNESDFFEILDRDLGYARDSLEIKRKEILQSIAIGLLPLIKHYIVNMNHFFSVIGIVGMHDCLLNFMGCGINNEDSRKFAVNVLKHIRRKLVEFQEQTGNLYALEATPAEGSAYRLARLDRKLYPDIRIQNMEEDGVEPYLVNSTQLPVGFTDDPFEALELQEELQSLYNSGTVFHLFIGESSPASPEIVQKIIRTIATKYKIPTFTWTPTFSICPNCGLIHGEFYTCPKCNKKTEVYSRVVGYLRPVSSFNKGKQAEFGDRKNYKI